MNSLVGNCQKSQKPKLNSESPLEKNVIISVKLLIVANHSDEANLIVQSLATSNRDFICNIITEQQFQHYSLGDQHYDLVLCAYHGFESVSLSPLLVLKRLAVLKIDIPCLVISDSVKPASVITLLKAGIADYLDWDELSRLSDRICQTLANRDRQQQQQQAWLQMEEQCQQQSIINHIIQRMRETLVIDHILQTTIDLLHEALGVTRCFIISPHLDHQVNYASQETPQKEHFLGLCCQLSYHFYPLLLEGNPIAHIATDSCLPLQLQEQLEQNQVQSFLIMPIFYQKSYLGAICLHHCREAHQWRESELNIISNVATQCAIAIQQAQLLATVEQQQQTELLLNQISQTLNSSLELAEILQEIVQQVGKNFEVDRVLIFRLNEQQFTIEQEWRVNPQISSLLDINISLEQLKPLTQSTATDWDSSYQQQNQVINQLLQAKIAQWESLSLLSVPIIIQGRLFGGLMLHSIQQQRNFSQLEITTVKRIANQAAIALNNAQRYHHLQQEFQQRSQELEQEKQRSESANLAKTEFLSHINHELRAPVGSIIGFARMLLEEIYGDLNDKQKQYLRAIASSGQHLLDLINDFLDISKIEAGKEQLSREKISIEELCLQSISLVKGQAKEAQLELNLEIATDIQDCIADQLRLKQILINLLSNAIKFTETGSVTLKVTQKDHILYWSVIDTGIGIAPEDQIKLFQPFQQLHTSIHRKHKGTGLGLALARKLAQLHGGEITLVSELGNGSCFTLELPMDGE